MNAGKPSRRGFMKVVGAGAAALSAGIHARGGEEEPPGRLDEQFPVKPGEITLAFRHGEGARRLSFAKFDGPPEDWAKACRAKLAELLRLEAAPPGKVRALRRARAGKVTLHALVMEIDEHLSIPAYLLEPDRPRDPKRGVIAIHGHGEAEPCIGLAEEYHHRFALVLAEEGHRVLCPELRGFGALRDMAAGRKGYCLDYWNWVRGPQFTLFTDALLYGRCIIGPTVEDLLRWEAWFAATRGIERVSVAGISYGGDLAFTYPAFSRRVDRIFSSGSFGSFAVVFSRCYNAPAHCIPGVLEWMDRSDIAGLNAPRPITFHYGALDTPGPKNNSAAYNETVRPALEELRAVYRAHGAEDRVKLAVTPDRGHEFDLDLLKAFMA